jgi:hypothetical protein
MSSERPRDTDNTDGKMEIFTLVSFSMALKMVRALGKKAGKTMITPTLVSTRTI